MGCSDCSQTACALRGIAALSAPESRVYLLGAPNSGKSTLFNALTGGRETIGNWPGVTVDRCSGTSLCDRRIVEIVDLPGVCSLSAPTADRVDERVAREAILTSRPDAILATVDLTAPMRSLAMLLQAMACGVPVVAALTKADYWPRDAVDQAARLLSERLGIPAAAVSSGRRDGLDDLKRAIAVATRRETTAAAPAMPRSAADALRRMTEAVAAGSGRLSDAAAASARRLLEHDRLTEELAGPALSAIRDAIAAETSPLNGRSLRDFLSGAYFEQAADLTRALKMPPARRQRILSDAIDRAALSPIFGAPMLLAVMYALFFLSINVSGVFVGFFDTLGQALFLDTPRLALSWLGLDGGVIELLIGAVGTGLQTVVTFAPVVGFLFLCQIVLEESGYMARAAVVADRQMRRLGLSGRAFLPMVLGFGCTIPAVLATRTLDTRAERTLTAMMAPFMSCGARLPVYAIFAAAFFPTNGVIVVFGLYLLGLAAALFTGVMLAPRLLPDEPRALAIELPAYQAPSLRRLARLSASRLSRFLADAGRTILIVVSVLSLLNSIGVDGSIGNQSNGRSILAETAKTVTPALTPMGVDQENWPAAVALVTGVFAKEAVVGTLQALYLGEDAAAPDPLDTARTAFADLGDAALGLAEALVDPLGLAVTASGATAEAAEAQGVEQGLFTALADRFNGPASAFAFMVVVLLYTPCAATLSTLWTEIGGAWAVASAAWSLTLAYASAVVAYQSSALTADPTGATLRIAGMISLIALIFIAVRNARPRGEAPRGRIKSRAVAPPA